MIRLDILEPDPKPSLEKDFHKIFVVKKVVLSHREFLYVTARTQGPNFTHLCVGLVLRSFTFFVFRSFSFFLFFKNWTLRLPFRSNQLFTRNILFLLCYVKNHKSVKANPEFLQMYEVESSVTIAEH